MFGGGASIESRRWCSTVRIEERTYTEALFSPDEWDTVQHGLQLLVEQHRDPVAARMLGIDVPESREAVTQSEPRRNPGRPRKQPQPEPTPEQVAEAERMRQQLSGASTALVGVTMEMEG